MFQRLLLLPASMELFDRTELVEELLIHQPRHKEKFVVWHELVNNLLFHSFSLQRTNVTSEEKYKDNNE